MFGIGGSELLIIAVIVVMLFGPDKLPKFARTIGRFMTEFKRYQAMMESTIRAEMYLTEEPADPFKKASEYQGKLKAEKDAAAQDAVEKDGTESVSPEDAAGTEGTAESRPADSEGDEAAAAPTAETTTTECDGLQFDAEGDIVYDPEDVGWVPGAPDAPTAEPTGEVGEEAEERP